MAVAAKAVRVSVPASSPKPYRVLIADDHSVVRLGLRNLLAGQSGIEICGEATTGTEAINAVRRMKPSLVILDLTMPEVNGLEVARAVREECPDTDVMILSIHFTEELARELLRAGVMAYVLKSDTDRELLAAVDHVRNRQPFFTGQLAASMLQTFVDGRDLKGASAGSTLSARELEVLQLLAEGKSNKQAAAALSVSTRTVESHRHRIMKKMEFDSFSALVRFAVRNNLVEL
jgi:DNA-binding NarL/FixJ family response regulator